MGTNCAPLLADLSVIHMMQSLHKIIKDKEIKEAKAFNLTLFNLHFTPMTNSLSYIPPRYN
jgi:hypothetical protein